jgi:hypothetical protein
VITGLFVSAFFIAKCDLPHTDEHPKRLRFLGLAAFTNSRRHITNRLVALANAKVNEYFTGRGVKIMSYCDMLDKEALVNRDVTIAQSDPQEGSSSVVVRQPVWLVW